MERLRGFGAFLCRLSRAAQRTECQESVSAADQAYISSLYSFNIAKVQLARSVGVAEQAVKTYLGGK